MWRLGRAFRTGGSSSRVYSTYQSFSTARTPLGLVYDNRRGLAIAAAVLGGIYAINLDRVPVSGRRRFIIVPRWLELRVGNSSYSQILGQYRGQLLPENHPDTLRVKRIMGRLIKVSGLDGSDIDWRIHVIGGTRQPPNAFVLPGGKVFVFQSILPIAQNDDGLATVLAHELAHQVCRHTAESMSKSPIYMAFMAALQGVTGGGALDSLLLNTVIKLPASRSMETEADYVGVMMMAKACFDPAAAIGLWQRMMQYEGRAGRSMPEFFSTHPASEHRIRNIQAELAEAQQLRGEHCEDARQFGFWRG